MKKTLFTILTALVLVFCSASASAAFKLPDGTTDIEDEAFMNAYVSYYLTIPEGVKTIGHRAFLGGRAMQVKLPASLSYIAPDAFAPSASFEVVPGSYAAQWCRENGYFCENMRVSVDKEDVVSYADKPVELKALCAYPGRVDFYRWEISSNLKNWYAAEDVTGDSFWAYYTEDLATSYVRCRASVNGVLLDFANYATVQYNPGTISIDTEKSKALSGDAIYLQWTNMGSGMEYYVNQWIPDASLEKGGSWQVISSKLTASSYTVYNLAKDTEYSFIVVALPKTDDGRNLRYESEEHTIRTLQDPYTFKITECRAEGTSCFVKWEPVDGAYYMVECIDDGKDPEVINSKRSSNSMWIYGFSRNIGSTIRVTAWVSDSHYENGRYDIAVSTAKVTSGDYDPSIKLNDITVTDGIAHLSWNALGGTTYRVHMSTDGGETFTTIATELEETYFDVSGLERGKQYSFKAEAVCGSWHTDSGWSAVTIPGKDASGMEYRALLIGEVSFPGTQYAARNYGDVEMIAEALENTKTPGGSHYSVLRRKDLNTDAILSNIRTAFGDADDNDVSLFFIGTHGDINDLGRDAGCLSTVDSSGKEGFLDLYVLADELSKVKGKVIVWLGSCGSGAAIYEDGVPQNGDEALVAAAMDAFSAYDTVVETDSGEMLGDSETFDTGEFRKAGKFYVLTAARYHQMSWGTGADTYNFFTKFITEGITPVDGSMPADADGNGKVTQHELFLYIKSCEEDDTGFIFQDVQEYPVNSEYVLFCR